MPDVLLRADEDGVRLLTLNRPDKLNALDMALTQSLVDELNAADKDASVRAVVLTGQGRAFCAGADTSEFKSLTPDNAKLVETRADLSRRMYGMLHGISKPIIAAVHGVAMGGGAGMAIGCDMLVVASDLKLAFPEIRHAILPALVMAHIERQFSPKLAFELMSTARQLSGSELFALGVANRVAERDAVLPTALALARELAKASPQAMSAMKALFHRAADLPFDSAMDAGREANALMRSYRTSA